MIILPFQQGKPDLYVLVVNLSSPRFDREDLKRVRKIKVRVFLCEISAIMHGEYRDKPESI